MPDPTKHELIILRRQESDEEHHKGGVWKIAHADFMTAMMAFFLVMWLISVSDKETQVSVANYFNPVKLAESTADRKGLKEPQNKDPGSQSPKPETEPEPQKQKGGASRGQGEDTGGAAPPAQRPRYKEGMLFQDPYAILAKISADAEQDRPHDTLGVDGTTAEIGEPGLNGGDAQRDPFDPLYWQVRQVQRPRTETPGAPETTTPLPKEGTIDALAPKPQAQIPATEKGKDPKVAPKVQTEAKATPPEGKTMPPASPPSGSDAAQTAQQSVAAELKAEIAKAVQSPSSSTPSPRIEVRHTGEGTLISITDDIDFSMFAIGSAEPQPKVVRAMEKIAKILSARPGTIIISGHTDARPFKSETYDNWRLSTARAHMAYYMLVRGGLDETRIEHVEGYADRKLKNKSDPKAAENRRIEILLRERPQ